jgi:membrane-bound lytic murein transglycosylase B
MRRHLTRRRPKHARPSVLAPTRSLVAAGGLAVFAGLAIAGCAVVTGGPAGAATRAVPPPVAAVPPAPAFVEPASQTSSDQALSSAADLAALRGADGGSASPSAEPTTPTVFRDDAPVSELAASGIPTTALEAYKNAAAREARRTPGCGLSWPLLAGIGRVESNHGRFAGAVLHSDGLSTPRVIGIPLDGHGTALIRDTDGGRYDGDTVYDRAVGPMQFIPSTWAGWGVDATGDGVRDPFNIYDAADAAAEYVCAAGRDLMTIRGQVQAILSYNYSYEYVALVMSLERLYASGAVGITVPVLPATPDPRHGRPAQPPPLPPVDPGTPGGLLQPGTPTPSPSPPSTSTPTATSIYTRPSNPLPLPSPSADSSVPSETTSPSGSPTPSDSPTAPTSPGSSG